MSNAAIPFSKASVVGAELRHVEQAVRAGRISGDGAYTLRCHELLETLTGARKALLTTSCTHALEMSALLLDVQPGDEVIVPAFTFVSTVNAFVLRGARPVFADVRPDTLNLDERQLESLITPKTKAIVPVHYAGVGCEMDAIVEIAARHRIAIVEDNAHGLFGSYKGRPLGSFGALATQSFHDTKNITCGEGGALLINDESLVERADVLREKGTNRSRFFKGQVDKYTWIDVGSSYLPSEMLAAFLWGQLEARDRIQTARRRIWNVYDERLRDWAQAHGVALPTVPAGCGHPAHIFYLLMPTPALRDALIAHLRARGIASTFHYLPLHLSEMGIRLGGHNGQCPVTESISARLVRLPIFNDLAEHDLDRIVQAVLSFPLGRAAGGNRQT
jgi:dTDP-4-amino-4,6-dideoxygalactose transaminase